MKMRRLISGVRGRMVELVTARQRLIDLETRVSSLEKSFDQVLISPKYVSSETVGFNGQRGRKRIFADIVGAIQFDALVETGTFFGDTAGFMHETTRLPVFTCESDGHFYLVAKKRLAGSPGITAERRDSREFLSTLAGDALAGKVVFFYLDAHWYRDIPLRGEIRIIAEHWDKFVIMVDDFKVPGDDGYRYEPYGAGQYFVLDTLVDELTTYGLKAYFPAIHSNEETGWKAGCVVLTRVGPLTEVLSGLGSLKEASPQWGNHKNGTKRSFG